MRHLSPTESHAPAKACLCALAIAACFFASAPAAARDCYQDLPESSAVVSKVVDGDTIVLSNQQRVRIIGLNTLELNAKDPQDRQWAVRATDVLDALLVNKRVSLRTGRDRKDRYGRLLAHVSLLDGQDAAQALIEQGLAIAVGVGRNTVCADNNLASEHQARSRQSGIWKNKGSWWKPADAPLQANRGFYVIRSAIDNRLGAGKKTKLRLSNGLIVKLGRQWPLNAEQTDTLLAKSDNQLVEVRGWIGGQLSTPELSLHHPANLRIVSQ